MQILEDEHGRPLFAHCLEEATPGGERLASALAAPTGLRPEAHEWPQVTNDPFRLGRVLDEHGNRIRELPGRLVRRVALENAGLRLRHLAQRPEADPVAVGEAATLPPGDQLRCCSDDLQQLGHEAALADPGHADERDELRFTLLPRTSEGVAQNIDLSLSADEGRERRQLDIAAEARPGRDCLPDDHGLRLALRVDRRRLAVLDQVRRGAIGCLTDQDAVDGRRRLDPGCGVDHVSRNHPLPLERVRVQRDERLARIDRHAQFRIRLARDVADRKGCPNGPLRIVLVHDGRTEHRHDRVADELLDRAAVSLQLGPDACVMRCQNSAHVFRVASLGRRRRADEVGEDDRDDLALLAADGRCERRATRGAESRLALALLPTVRAHDHTRECTTKPPRRD